MIELPKPGLAERARLIRQYFSAYLHHDPPSDFLLQPPAPAVLSAPAALTGTAGGEPPRSEGAAAARRGHDDDHGSGTRDTPRPNTAPPSPHPELEGEAEGCPPPPAAKAAGKSEGGNGCRGGGRAFASAVRISEGFRDKSPGLMAMLAVRSEGFYGRDMAHFFSAVQVRRKGKNTKALLSWLIMVTKVRCVAGSSGCIVVRGRRG